MTDSNLAPEPAGPRDHLDDPGDWRTAQLLWAGYALLFRAIAPGFPPKDRFKLPEVRF